jgi:hypothetical protein
LKAGEQLSCPQKISTHPACLNDLSGKPPQNTPTVAIAAFAAASCIIGRIADCNGVGTWGVELLQ